MNQELPLATAGESLGLSRREDVKFLFNWPLTLVALIVVPAFVLPTRSVSRSRRNLSLATQETQSKLSSMLGETLN